MILFLFVKPAVGARKVSDSSKVLRNVSQYDAEGKESRPARGSPSGEEGDEELRHCCAALCGAAQRCASRGPAGRAHRSRGMGTFFGDFFDDFLDDFFIFF